MLSAGSTLGLSLLHNPVTSNVTYAPPQLSGSSDCDPLPPVCSDVSVIPPTFV